MAAIKKISTFKDLYVVPALHLILPALILFSAATPLSAAPRKIDSAPNKVVVYTDRALVQRVVKVSLPVGISQVEFYDLPVDIDPSTIQVSTDNDKRVQIFSLEVSRDYLYEKDPKTGQPAPDQRKKLEDRLEQLNKDLTILSDRQKNLNRKKQLLRSIEAKQSTDLNGQLREYTIDPAKWAALLEFSYTQNEAIDNELRQITQRQKEIREEITKINNQLSGPPKTSNGVYKALVSLEAATETQATLTIQYITYKASWKAEYDIRTNDGKEVKFDYKGVVRQNSGENWDGVSIVLSTARPALGLDVAKLAPLRLRKHVAQYKRHSRGDSRYSSAPQAAMKEESVADEGEMLDLAPGPELVPPTQVTRDLTSTSFEGTRKVYIPGNGTSISVPVLSTTLAADVTYTANPEYAEAVFIHGTLKNTMEYPILPGKTNLYLAGRFIGTSNLTGVAPGDSVELPLGADDSIKITRKKLKEYREDTGLTESKVRITYHYEIEIENLKKRAVTIEIGERVPVSSDEDIKVTIKEVTPKDFTEDPQKPGVYSWKIVVGGGDKKKIIIKYSVEAPRGVVVEPY